MMVFVTTSVKKIKRVGHELLVMENFTEGSNWKTLPYTRYALLKDGNQIDGMDIQGKRISRSSVRMILERNELR